MLRFLLKMSSLLWFLALGILLAMLKLGKSAPDISRIAFFSQEFDGTDYWHLDILTGVSFKDHYSSNFLINLHDNVRTVPLRHFITIIEDANMKRIYEVNLDTRELRHIADYPLTAHYAILAGEFIFPIDYSSGSYNWTRIHIASRVSEFFLEDTYLISARVSPDSRWMAGALSGGEHLFINLLDASTYRISGYCCIAWSPDGQWYIATHSSREFVSVLNADNGEYHPLLPENFPAPHAYWARDSLSILYQSEEHLASISLLTGSVEDYPIPAETFWTACSSPNQGHILSSSGTELRLSDRETGTTVWRFNHAFSRHPNCFWSEDSRYLSLHLLSDRLDNSGQVPRRDNWQSYFFIDTIRQSVWELSPENLPMSPIYMYIPD